jgi:hypothetical protein
MRKVIYILIVSVLFTACDKEKNSLRQANKIYEKKDYKNAEKAYRKTLFLDSLYAKAMFNLANTNYKLADTNSLKTALQYYNKSFDNFKGKDTLLQTNVLYNKGNTKFKLAMQDSAKKNETYYNHLKEAKSDYKEVLRRNSTDSCAKYNLALIDYLLQQNQSSKEQNKQQQQQNNQSEPQNKNKQPKNQKQDNENNNQNTPPPNIQKAKDKQEIDRILEALRNNEKNTLKRLNEKQQQNASKIRSEKDW